VCQGKGGGLPVKQKNRSEVRGNNTKPKRKQKQKQKQKQSPEELSPKGANGNSIPSFSQLTANEDKKNGNNENDVEMNDSERKPSHKATHFRDREEGEERESLPAQGLAALKQVIDDEQEEEESVRPSSKKRDRMESEEGDLEIHEKDDDEDCNDK